MQTYEKPYTSGALNTESGSPATATAGTEARTSIQEQTPTRNTPSKSWIQWASNQLDDIAKLGPDWDSYGGDAPSSLAISTASTLLQIVYKYLGMLAHEQSQPQVVAPRPDGGIQIEWGTRPVQIAVHADPSGVLGYLFIDRQGDIPKYEEVSNASLEKLLQLIVTTVFTVPR